MRTRASLPRNRRDVGAPRSDVSQGKPRLGSLLATIGGYSLDNGGEQCDHQRSSPYRVRLLAAFSKIVGGRQSCGAAAGATNTAI